MCLGQAQFSSKLRDCVGWGFMLMNVGHLQAGMCPRAGAAHLLPVHVVKDVVQPSHRG